jgi:alkylhydroperoxidase/carboxymuconolactone decarboxylase family protein YurZ
METQTRQSGSHAAAETSSSVSTQTVSNVWNVAPGLERYRQVTLFWRPLAASRFVASGSQRGHAGSPDRAQSDSRAAVLPQRRVGQRGHARRDFRGHHPPRVLLWAGNATAAVAVASDVFAQRGIGADQLPAASSDLLPLDEAAEEQRATRVQQDVGRVSPGLVQYTGDLLFRELWLRPDRAPRDRSLVTVSALIASGQVAQLPFHLNRAMDNGLTEAQPSEVLTHVAFYAGWPNAMSAVPVVKGIFESRAS